MFAFIAAMVFAIAFTLAIGTMAFMFAAYRDKMVAALLYRPLPQTTPVYYVAVRRRRARSVSAARAPLPFATGIAA